MKVCPNCKAELDDETLIFCTNCGKPLNESNKMRVSLENDANSSNSSFTQNQTSGFSNNYQNPPPKRSGNMLLISAIVGGFLLLAIVVGAFGVIWFSREESANQTSNQNSSTANRETVASQSNTMQNSPVEKLPTNKNSNNATNATNATNALPQIVASASSVRKPDKGNVYFPNLAFDGNSSTAWCEGGSGAGIGEWLRFDFDREVTLKSIKVQAGYFKNIEVWAKNNRVAAARFDFSDGTSKNFSFADEMTSQTFEVGRTKTRWVKITIEDYNAGNSDSEDTLVSEVSFVTEP
ncbi:MAG: discoidin domain-containing protein [Pyrinomonadaceae bacterium]|nr:discoidin domain-containing protein [Pyrinomonadaceae bacterium]